MLWDIIARIYQHTVMEDDQRGPQDSQTQEPNIPQVPLDSRDAFYLFARGTLNPRTARRDLIIAALTGVGAVALLGAWGASQLANHIAESDNQQAYREELLQHLTPEEARSQQAYLNLNTGDSFTVGGRTIYPTDILTETMPMVNSNTEINPADVIAAMGKKATASVGNNIGTLMVNLNSILRGQSQQINDIPGWFSYLATRSVFAFDNGSFFSISQNQRTAFNLAEGIVDNAATGAYDYPSSTFTDQVQYVTSQLFKYTPHTDTAETRAATWVLLGSLIRQNMGNNDEKSIFFGHAPFASYDELQSFVENAYNTLSDPQKVFVQRAMYEQLLTLCAASMYSPNETVFTYQALILSLPNFTTQK